MTGLERVSGVERVSGRGSRLDVAEPSARAGLWTRWPGLCLAGVVVFGCEIVEPGTDLTRPEPAQATDTVQTEGLELASGPFHATSIGVGSPFALKGSAWGRSSAEGDRVIVSVDSLRLWRDPSRGRDGGPRAVASVAVGLASGSLALSWTVTARGEQRRVDEVLDLDESVWLRDFELELPLPPETSSAELEESWLVFTALDADRRSRSHFHSRIRLSGRSAASLDGLPVDYRGGLARVLQLEEIVGGRAISIVSSGEIHTAVRRLAADRGIPVCVYDSPDATAHPSFSIRGLVPRTPDAFAVRVSQFEADGALSASITVGLVRSSDGGWEAAVERHLAAPVGLTRPAGQSFCHRDGGDPAR